MTTDDPSRAACHEVRDLLPWYVNGTLTEDERHRVNLHLPFCVNCRTDLAQDRLVYRGMNVDTGVEYMPAASLKRLQARLDAIDGAVPAKRRDEKSNEKSHESRGRPMQRSKRLAAAVAAMAAALGLVLADQWMQFRARVSAPNYYTVTTPLPRPPGAVIRAVFSPTATIAEVQAILDEAGLRIVFGPTEAGVYSLAADSHRPVSSSLELMRANAKVRFAESIQAAAGAEDSP